MPLSSGGATLLAGGIQALGTWYSTKGIAKAQKEAAKAQARLIDLQAEEQQLRNQALRMSLVEQDKALPFAISNPSLPGNAYAGNVRPTGTGLPGAAAEPSAAGPGAFLVVAAAGAAVVALLSIKAKAA